jgi:chemotaxis protein methyltransferase CheR
MTNKILPELTSKNNGSTIKIWSAGCSSGEEPYTIAMVMHEFSEHKAHLDYSIFATDLSTQVLNKAVTAVYNEDRVATLPFTIKKKFFLRSKSDTNRTVRVVPELRRKVIFQRLNFMDDHYDVPQTFDIIFCRNVLIYFDKDTQEKVINKLASKLRPGGYFFLGHSESVTQMDVPLSQIKPTVFKKI